MTEPATDLPELCVCGHDLLCHEALYGECIVPDCSCGEFQEGDDVPGQVTATEIGDLLAAAEKATARPWTWTERSVAAGVECQVCGAREDRASVSAKLPDAGALSIADMTWAARGEHDAAYLVLAANLAPRLAADLCRVADLMCLTEQKLDEAITCLAAMFNWQADINELMPDGLGDRVRKVLGDAATDKLFGLPVREQS